MYLYIYIHSLFNICIASGANYGILIIICTKKEEYIYKINIRLKDKTIKITLFGHSNGIMKTLIHYTLQVVKLQN